MRLEGAEWGEGWVLADSPLFLHTFRSTGRYSLLELQLSPSGSACVTEWWALICISPCAPLLGICFVQDLEEVGCIFFWAGRGGEKKELSKKTSEKLSEQESYGDGERFVAILWKDGLGSGGVPGNYWTSLMKIRKGMHSV